MKKILNSNLVFAIALCVTPIIGINSASAKPAIVFGGFNNGLKMGFTQDKTIFAEQSRLLSLRDVAQMINSQVPGSVLNASGPHDINGRKVFRVRWQANSGAIIDFEIDAESGQILKRVGG
jgi:hypothetical protein